MGKFGKKFSLDAESPVVQASDQILSQQKNQEQGGVAQPIPVVNQEMQTVAQPAAQLPQQVVTQSAPVLNDQIPYNEVLKNVGAKIPYSIYDRLERIKRQSERSGIKADKRNIGDLIAQAIKEFVEKYDK